MALTEDSIVTINWHYFRRGHQYPVSLLRGSLLWPKTISGCSTSCASGNHMRGVIRLLVQESGNATLTAVAERFDRDLSFISRNVATVQSLIKEDRTFRKRYMEVRNHATSQA